MGWPCWKAVLVRAKAEVPPVCGVTPGAGAGVGASPQAARSQAKSSRIKLGVRCFGFFMGVNVGRMASAFTDPGCHPERSEGSAPRSRMFGSQCLDRAGSERTQAPRTAPKILRCAQDDRIFGSTSRLLLVGFFYSF